MGLQFHDHCLICNCTSLNELKRYHHAYLITCTNCGFVFSSRIPSQEELKAYYSYPRSRIVSTLTIKRYHEILDTLEPYRKNNTIMDVGCSNGYFLEVAKKRGWITYGTEFSDEAIETCRKKGIQMQKGILNREDYKNIKFDAVCAFELIEHINYPMEKMKNIYHILRIGGVFYFTTPNFNSISRYLLKEKWSIIVYPEHLSYYSAKTIHQLLTENAFRKIRLFTSGISLSRISKVLNKNTNADELLRNTIEENIFLRFIKHCINFLLNVFKNGDALKGFYQKI